MTTHLSMYHPRTKEQHYCVLCERSFSSAQWFQRHLQSREHLQLEKTQRRTIQTLFMVFTGKRCTAVSLLYDYSGDTYELSKDKISKVRCQ